ncbi:MAG: YkoP family protein [Candidatus Dormibacteraceae bacterium]
MGWARGGRAVGVLDAWIVYERISERLEHVHPIREGGAFRYSVRRHRGPAVVLRDHGWVGKGATIVELHLDNRRFAELTRTGTHPMRMMRLFREDLRALAALIEGGALGPVAALHGVSLAAPATRGAGFEVRALPRTLHRNLERFFFAGLLLLYNSGGWRSVERQADRWPAEAWMSAGELRRRYGARARK